MTHIAPGIERFLADPPSSVRGRRLGLLSNPTGVDRRLRSSANLLAADGRLTLTALYGPEHGIRGEAQAGERVVTDVDSITGLPVHSLYGDNRSPTPEMLDPIDVLLVDIQDVGVRYTTYLSTLALVMNACAEHGRRVVILDRPNPLGGNAVSGNKLEPAFASFVGVHSIPIRHGLTIGEFGRLWARDMDLPEPEVVTIDGWGRDLWFDQTGLPWVLPSPNLPTLDTLTVYPATCLLEGTNLSEGRGTTRPFELVGAPWIDPEALAVALDSLDLTGVGFRPAVFVPTYSKHQGARCGGVQIHILDRDRIDHMRLGFELLATMKRLEPDSFEWLPRTGKHHFIDLLAGSPALREQIDRGQSGDDLLSRWRTDSATFARERSDILLY